ncbi:hypothetical protein OF83DRAFT_1175311 [Amylostereum chailletii]|nr:hypothetical protein OF83DRAFT_1175311 [Amylostereum chailletii]
MNSMASSSFSLFTRALSRSLRPSRQGISDVSQRGYFSCKASQAFRVPSAPRPKRLLPPSPSRVAYFSHNAALRATYRDTRQRFPPPPRGGLFQKLLGYVNRIDPDVFFYGIIGLNGAVFAGWAYSSIRNAFEQKSDLLHWMHDNFTVSARNIDKGHIWTLLTSCFSHKDFDHILMNGVTFFFMAPPVLQILGNARFLALYLGGGIISSLTSVSWNKGRNDYASHGASGAVFAVISFFACVHPRARLLIFFVLPCPAWAAVAGLLALDGYSSMNNSKWRAGVDTAGHVGGILAGIAYWALRFRLRRF